jgi:hypothetical protein
MTISFVGVCWKGGDGRKHLFVGIDDAMQIGLRAPSNVFGHSTDQSLVDIDQQLSQWDHDNSAPVTKIVFGHFPMAFTTSTEKGKHPEGIFAKHNISAYVCGHLHTKFGKHLYNHHRYYWTLLHRQSFLQSSFA